MTPAHYLLPVEVIYRQLAEPRPQEAKRICVDAPAIKLSRDDVTAIITRKRSATADELQDIIANAKAYKLTTGERNQLCLDLSICVAQRARQVNGKREDASARFVSDLGYAQTPFGLLAERAWFQNELQTGTKAIAACRRHLPPECACWREARENLYNIRASYGEKSPESWAALRVWEALEQIEQSSRPERGPGIA
jgi:hypothetical protein